MNIKETRRSNLQRLIQERQLSFREFAERIERSPAQVSAIAGKTPHKGLGDALARHIETTFSLPRGYLDRSTEDAVVVSWDTRRLPVLGIASAGRLIENIQSVEVDEYVMAPGPTGPKAFALRIDGISMEPRFREGDKIIIDPDLDWRSGDYVFAIKKSDDTGTFKQLRAENDDFYLAATNPSFEPRYIRMDADWEIIGKAKWRVEDL